MCGVRRAKCCVQAKIAELQSEVQWHEEQRLKAWAQQEASQEAGAASASVTQLQEEDTEQQALSINGSIGALSSLDSNCAAAAAAAACAQRMSADVRSTAAPRRHQPEISSADGCTLESPILSAVPLSSLLGVQHQHHHQQQPSNMHSGPVSQHADEDMQRDAPAEAAESPVETAATDDLSSKMSSVVNGEAAAAVARAEDRKQSNGVPGHEGLDVAAIFRRPQRPAAKPLPPVPRFDRCNLPS